MSDAIISRRGGGVGLNFRVTQYPVGTDLSNIIGKHNEIAVLTNTAITEWTIGPSEPSFPEVGSVWIKAGKSSHTILDALKKSTIRKNVIELRLENVRQYATGSWGLVKAYIFRNGQWNDLITYAYDRGDQCTILTGGWTDTNGSCSYGTEYIQVPSSDGVRGCRTTNLIRMDDFATLYLVCTNSGSAADSAFGITTKQSNLSRSDFEVYLSPTAEAHSEETTLQLDVSNITGEYYIACVTTLKWTRIMEVYLE